MVYQSQSCTFGNVFILPAMQRKKPDTTDQRHAEYQPRYSDRLLTFQSWLFTWFLPVRLQSESFVGLSHRNTVITSPFLPFFILLLSTHTHSCTPVPPLLYISYPHISHCISVIVCGGSTLVSSKKTWHTSDRFPIFFLNFVWNLTCKLFFAEHWLRRRSRSSPLS